MEVPREKAMLMPFVRANVSVGFPGEVLAKRYPQLLKPTRAKFATSMISFGHPLGLGWLKLDRVGLNLIKAQIFAQLSPSFQVFHVWPPLPTQANSRQVALLLLCEYAVVFRQLNGFLASWLDLAVPFGQPPMQVWFCNLVRVGLSCECRWTRA